MEDRELARRLAGREAGSADELLRRHGPMLRYIIAPILSDPREREECLNDVVMRVWERAGQYDPERGSFAAWLSAIARNTARSRLQRGMRAQEPLSPDEAVADPAPGPEELVLRQERARRLREAVAALGETQRQLFYRKYYYLQSTAQMAAELGMTQRAVEGRLRRLRAHLRRELGGDGDV